jgi:hypothetical protein
MDRSMRGIGWKEKCVVRVNLPTFKEMCIMVSG